MSGSALGLRPVFIGYGCVVALFVLWALCEPETAGAKEPRPSTRRELELGFRSSKVRTALLAILFTAAASGTVQLLAPLHLSAAGLSNASIGWVFTATAVASLTAMLLLATLLNVAPALKSTEACNIGALFLSHGAWPKLQFSPV